MMLLATPINIILALIFYPVFISDYHTKEPRFLFSLFLFLINAVLALYQLLFYFILLK